MNNMEPCADDSSKPRPLHEGLESKHPSQERMASKLRKRKRPFGSWCLSGTFLIAVMSLELPYWPASAFMFKQHSVFDIRRAAVTDLINGDHRGYSADDWTRTVIATEPENLNRPSSPPPKPGIERSPRPPLVNGEGLGRKPLMPETFNGVNGDASPNEEETEQEDRIHPLCRVVALSDGKLPASETALPAALFQHPHLLRRLDDIYHAMAHDEIKLLKYMDASNVRTSETDRHTYNRQEDRTLISVLRTSLEDAGFELLSRRDLDLCEALNTGYLLRLSILPDLANLDPALAKQFYPERFDRRGKPVEPEELLFEGRILVYRRGYSQEVTHGRLFLRKIDHLQASVVQRSAAWVKSKLDHFERWVAQRSRRAYRTATAATLRTIRSLAERIPYPSIAKALLRLANRSYLGLEVNGASTDASGKIFKLARYGGSKIRFVGSPNPTDALTPFVICENSRYCGPDKTTNGLNRSQVDSDIYQGLIQQELECPYDEGKHPRKPLPPMQLLERVSISNLVDLFSREGRESLWKTIFAKSELIEPSYEEVVVIWRPLPKQPPQPLIRPPQIIYELADMFDIEGLPSLPKENVRPAPSPLEIRTFDGVPMANIQAILPKTKLVFRPADAFVFDMISVFSFLLVIGSQQFNSPRLDFLALASVSLWILRTVLRYSNKLARYDLLVKTFLTSKISHRNSGAVKYITTEAGTQRAVRAALVHQWLTQRAPTGYHGQGHAVESDLASPSSLYHPDEDLYAPDFDRESLAKTGAREVNELIRDVKQYPINMEAALNDLEDLNLIRPSRKRRFSSRTWSLEEKEEEEAKEMWHVEHDATAIVQTLKRVWNSILDARLSLQTLVGRRDVPPQNDNDDELL